MEEEIRNQEGKEAIDEPAATSAAPVEPQDALSSTPVPTEEEREEAGMAIPEAEMPEPEAPSAPEPEGDEPEGLVPEPDIESVEPAPEMPEAAPEETPGVIDAGPAMRTFSQDEVNDMVGNTRVETREKTFRYIYDRYGVGSERELDDLIGNAQRYDSLKERYDSDSKNWKDQSAARDKELSEIREQVALLQSGISKDRYDDAKFILRGKGLEVSPETIQQELASHPEWTGSASSAPDPDAPFAKDPSKARDPMLEHSGPESRMTSVMGNEQAAKDSGPSEEDMVMSRYFKV